MPADFLVERGKTGLAQFGGRVASEWLAKLDGERGRRVFREMADNDPTVGAVLFCVEMLLRSVEWRVEPFSDDPGHVEDAQFLESCLHDMSHTWDDFVGEVVATMLPYGFSPHEIVYKRREGPAQRDPSRRSKHSDGMVGWRKLAVRSPWTVDRWEFDTDGGVQGFWQVVPTEATAPVYLPVKKLLLFRTTHRLGNPEGRSALRNAFLPWYRKKHVEEAEAIGVDRDLAGMPVFYLPPELFLADAPPAQLAQLAEYKRVVANVKQDEQAGLLLPAVFDERGNRLVEFQLMGTGSRRIFDTAGIAQRYDRQIAQTVLADFILLGHERVGSFALSSDKTDIFATAAGGWLKSIAAVVNRHGVSRLWELNGLDPAEAPEAVPGDLEKRELDKFAAVVSALTGTGWLTPGAEADEDHVRELLGLPAFSGERPSPAPTEGPGGEETSDTVEKIVS